MEQLLLNNQEMDHIEKGQKRQRWGNCGNPTLNGMTCGGRNITEGLVGHMSLL